VTASATHQAEIIRQSYRDLTSSVPAGIESRLELAEAAGRMGSVVAVEAMREP